MSGCIDFCPPFPLFEAFKRFLFCHFPFLTKKLMCVHVSSKKKLVYSTLFIRQKNKGKGFGGNNLHLFRFFKKVKMSQVDPWCKKKKKKLENFQKSKKIDTSLETTCIYP